MTLHLYNTLTRQKDDLEKLAGFDRTNVRMYVCGPTVYDFAHIGNARPVIVFDVLYRLLRHLYGESHVKYVRNITDIDDKINARAAETATAKNISVEQARAEITAQTAQQYLDDVAALGCLMPNESPRATQYVPQMIAMIERLIAEGHAYAAEGHVLFDVSSKPDYGKLARRSPDEMMAGARVEVAPYKKNPMDFVLWKPSDDQTPGWPSPWGRGRPGWHIECSAMSESCLGPDPTIDIHGGGIDLMFPHHENEIAQSEGAHHGHSLARVWMHNGFLQVEGEKMSKSLGNFVTIRELLEGESFGGQSWDGQVLRHAMLKTHYRQPIDWTLRSLMESDATMYHWFVKADDVYDQIVSRSLQRPLQVPSSVLDALRDDLNTPLALSQIHQIEAAMDAAFIAGEDSFYSHAEHFLTSLNLLGLTYDLSESIRQKRKQEREAKKQDIAAQIQNLIAARTAARKARDFKKADEIRDELLSKGIVLKDGPTGTTWEVKR
jgi:cysteinyl-tRNA synthetase